MYQKRYSPDKWSCRAVFPMSICFSLEEPTDAAENQGMLIRDWPASERPREKLLARGASALLDAELLAILLRTGVRGKSAVELARELLDQFGGLCALLCTDRTAFCSGKGLSEAKFVQLQAVHEIARRHLLESVQRGDSLSNPTETRAYLAMRLCDYAFEAFAALILDTRQSRDGVGGIVSRHDRRRLRAFARNHAVGPASQCRGCQFAHNNV